MTNIKNTKRALLSSVMALLLCFTMLLGTTFAWFTDSVTSAGNIIQTGELKVGFEWADGTTDPSNTTWKDASEGAIFDYANWEPGYAVARHLKVSNEGTLALNYQMRIVANGIVTKLADVIDVYYFAEDKALVRDDIADAEYLGTLAEVLGTEKNLSKKVYGALKAGDAADIHTIVLKMNENAGNEYQNMDLGCAFSVELIASQMASESDSFDNKYDDVTNVPNPAIPAALVRPLEDLDVSYTLGIGGAAATATLDTGFKFEPTMSLDEALLSEYQLWHADFVVYTDVDVPANSMMLAGYYDAWCQYNNNNWVGLTADEAIAANTEIRLVEVLGATVNWEDLCRYGNDGLGFQCGAADLTGENAGTTLTVELRLYKVGAQGDCANGGGCKHPSVDCEISADDYITVGKFTYTFPKTVDTEAGLSESLATGGTITLAAGEYKMPSNQSSTADLTIVGTKDTVVDVTLGAYMDKANVTFKGVTIKTSTGKANGNGSDYAALYTPNVTYIDCTFEGPMRVGRDGAKFINCTFNSLGNDYVWTYGNDVTFEGCTFNTDGKAILIYSDGGSEVSEVKVINCVFNSTKGAKAGAIANQNCAAIEIHNYGNGVNLITSGNTYDDNFSGEWRIKTYESGKPAIIVNGTTYTQIAIDGKLMTIDADKNVTVQ